MARQHIQNNKRSLQLSESAWLIRQNQSQALIGYDK